MTESAYRSLRADFIAAAAAASAAGDTAAAEAWELATNRLGQALAESLQDLAASGEPDFIERLRHMEEPELCERILNQRRHIRDYQHALEGLPVPAPVAKSSGIYFPDDIRAVVEHLLEAAKPAA